MAEKNLGKVAVTTGGAYSSSSSYEKLTIVSYNGNSYISKSAVPAGMTPTNTTYWQLVAEKGETGEQGPPGAQGKDGATGPAGEQGNSGYTGAADELEVVNNLTQGGATAALSAEMGKVLNDKVKSISQNVLAQLVDTAEPGFFIVDSQLNIGFSVTEQGIQGVGLPSFINI